MRPLNRGLHLLAVRHPGEQAAVREMTRVVCPGGPLLLADHVAGAAWPVRAAQRAIAAITVPVQGEHFTRRPLGQVHAAGLQIIRRERFTLGLIERLAAANRLPNKAGTSRGILGPEPCCRIARKGETMSYTRQMLDTYPRTLNLHPGLLAAAIDAASDCAQACTPTPTPT
jgi:hypothetical protein